MILPSNFFSMYSCSFTFFSVCGWFQAVGNTTAVDNTGRNQMFENSFLQSAVSLIVYMPVFSWRGVLLETHKIKIIKVG